MSAATSASGQPFGAPADLVTGADTPSSARLAGDGLGGLVAAWTQADGTSRRAFARLYDDTPPPVSERRNAGGARRRPGRDVLGDGERLLDRRHAGVGLRRRPDGDRRAGSHAYAAGGLFAVSVRARDAAGNLSDKIERVVRVTGPPAGGGRGRGREARRPTRPLR